MLFNTHSNLVGQHAFLSASQYHWINYTEEKLDARFLTAMAARRGTELHEFASEAIRLGIKLPATKKTLNMYVNDAIGFRMAAEQVLYYSDNCFGTADAIGIRKNKLRIFDLKTGDAQTSEHQLEVYGALFCLEYNYKPFELEFDLRIYQSDEVREYEGDPDAIMHIMEKIKQFDKRITAMRLEALR
jgi:hypothetical protein